MISALIRVIHFTFGKLYLGRREAAIVSPFAGTTRDVLEISLDIGGYPVVLCDTAGLRLSDDPIENEGLKRAKVTASLADLVIIVVDASKLSTLEHSSLAEFIDDQCSRLNVPTGKVLILSSINISTNVFSNEQFVSLFI